MKKESTASNQVIKPILYILFYLVILILLIQFMTKVVNAEKGAFHPEKKEIIIDENKVE